MKWTLWFGGNIRSKVNGPAWLSVAANGALSGTPANGDVGANQFTVRVTDQGGLSDDATMNIAVNNVNDSPTFLANPLNMPNATQGTVYSGSIASQATDPDLPYGDTLTFSKTSGPAWLTVAANGTLSGTPLSGDVGADSFGVRVTDSGGLYADATMNITVNSSDVLTGLVSRWTFDNSGNLGADSVGSNNGTGTNATYTTTAKRGAGAVSFAGNGYISVPYSSTLALNTYTVSAWVKIASTPITAYGILGTRFGGTYTFDWKINPSLIHADIGSGSAWISTAVDIASTDTGSNGQGGQLTVGTWYLVTYVIDNTAKQFRLLINGDVKKTITFTGTPTLMNSGETLRIGDSYNTEYMNGVIDDVRIYSRALSNAEVLAVYNAN